MVKKTNRKFERTRRHIRVRRKISGTAERPRLCVYRSNTNIYAQVIDDVAGKTLVSASTLDKEVKTKKDALVDFEKAQRQDLIDQTNQEIAILQEYLPKQLSREEVKAEVEKIISEIGATSMKDMGTIMKEAKAKLGASAEGKTINEVAKEIMGL